MRILDADGVAEALRRHLETEGMTQRDFSQKHGISESYVSRVINGIDPPGPAIAAALGLEPKTVYMGSAT